MAPSTEYGIVFPLLHQAKEQARLAESLGFDYLATGEHIMFHGPTSNNLVALAAAAGATERIGLLSGIVLVPLYPAALLAKQVAMLDVVSGGRFNLGVGIGGEFPREFDAVGVPVGERAARTDETLQVLELLLGHRDVSFEGHFTTLTDFTISPPPVQAKVPVWVAGRKEGAMKRAARFGDVWMPYMYTPEMLSNSLDQIAELADGREVTGAVYIFTCVHEDRQKALVIFASACPADYVEENTRLIAEGIVELLRNQGGAGSQQRQAASNP